MDFRGIDIDWVPILKSPLILGLPYMFAIAFCVWIVNEACSYFVPVKFRPASGLLLGVAFGYAIHRADMLIDFGAGEDGWMKALIFGVLAGAVAVVGHPYIKGLWPFSVLTRMTPSTPPPAAPEGGK